MRDAICDAAVRFAGAIGYRNLGTVEFVVDADTGEHYFLEINCRIQVEHPVTEAVTGRDLVALQLRIADGRTARVHPGRRHARRPRDRVPAERRGRGARVHADARAPCRCSPSLSCPGSGSTRTVIRARSIPPYYDSLMAKLIAHAPDRDAALDVLIEALEDLDVEGVETNRTLLISVLGHDDFRSGAVTTDWLERAIV